LAGLSLLALCIFYNQRDATYTVLFIIISALYISGGVSAHHQDLIKTVCATLGIVMLSCCLPLVWIGWNCWNRYKVHNIMQYLIQLIA